MESPENVGERRGGKCGGSRAHPHRPCDGFRTGGFCRGRFHAACGGTRPPKVLKSPFPKACSFPERILRGKNLEIGGRVFRTPGADRWLPTIASRCRPLSPGVPLPGIRGSIDGSARGILPRMLRRFFAVGCMGPSPSVALYGIPLERRNTAKYTSHRSSVLSISFDGTAAAWKGIVRKEP